MNTRTPQARLRLLATAFAMGSAIAGNASATTELTGWALMPANTFAPGPTSGQFVTGPAVGSATLPYLGQQPVQGLSAVLRGPTGDTYYVMPDNGFGAQGNSADAMLRVYAVKPDFRSVSGGSATVAAADYVSGATLPSFSAASFISLRDPDHKLGFPIVASRATYYPSSPIPVDASVQSQRLLTGADFDIESMRQDKHGNLWFGEEFGPFLVKTDNTGKVLRQEVALPGVQAPQNPYLAGPPNLGTSRGFEGMAINQAGGRLYTLLEGTVTGDAPKTLRINEFDIESEHYTDVNYIYQLDAAGTNIGDMTAIDDHRFLVLERNGATATGGGVPFKKVFLIDTAGVANGGTVKKTELVDLMNIADPHDLDGDGSKVFTFPYVTIEDVLLLDNQTLLVINDNNYPFGGGRNVNVDNTEFLRLHLAQPVPLPAGAWLMLSGLAATGAMRRRRVI